MINEYDSRQTFKSANAEALALLTGQGQILKTRISVKWKVKTGPELDDKLWSEVNTLASVKPTLTVVENPMADNAEDELTPKQLNAKFVKMKVVMQAAQLERSALRRANRKSARNTKSASTAGYCAPLAALKRCAHESTRETQ